MTSAADVLQMIKDNDCKYVDLRVTDLLGKEMHLTIPADKIDEDTFELGQPFDGSSFVGWRGIESSDMLLQPDPSTARMDPFREANTLVLNCDVLEPTTGKGYERDPRSLAHRAEAYLKSTGIGDTILARNPNSSFLIPSSGIISPAPPSSKLVRKKRPGRPVLTLKAAILVTATAPRGATSLFRPATA